MSQMNQQPNGRGPGPAVPGGRAEEVRVSSVILGLAMVIALIVTVAAWMGGSLSSVEARFANAIDGTARSIGLSVANVEVIGLNHDPALKADIRAAAMIEPGENMWRADPHKIHERIEATGEVVNVRVHRLWPDQVVIMVDPAEPVAVWHRPDGAQVVVDALGRSMPGATGVGGDALVSIAGAGAGAAVPELLAGISDYPGLGDRIERAVRIAGRRWNLELVGDIEVRLPYDARLAPALARLDRLESAHRLSERPVSYVDLRVTSRTFLAPSGTPEDLSSPGAA